MSVTNLVTDNPSEIIVCTPQGKPNLRPFSKTNQPPNAGRKPGSRSASTVLRDLLETVAPDAILNKDFIKQYAKNIKGKPTIKDALAARLAYNAITKGDVRAQALLYDRVDGKAPQTVTIENRSDALKQRLVEAVEKLLGADPNDNQARKDAFLLLRGMDAEESFGLEDSCWQEVGEWIEAEVVNVDTE